MRSGVPARSLPPPTPVPSMPAPYSRDLRTRLVNWYTAGSGTVLQAALHFSVGEATASRWVVRFKRTQSVEPKPMGGARSAPLLSDADLDAVRRIVADEPSLTLVEIADRLVEDAAGPRVKRQTMSRALKKLGLTRKKTHPGSTRSRPRA